MALIDGLVSYWAFESLLADSFGANTFTNNNAVTQAAGKIGRAASFAAASTQYLSHADNAALRVGAGSFTFDGWLFPTDVTTGNPAVLKKENGGFIPAGYRLDFFSGNIRAATYNTGVAVGFVQTAITANVWTYFRWWLDADAGTINLRLNEGVLVSAATTGNQLDGADAFELGVLNHGVGNEYYDGLMDEFGFWKRILTAEEAALRYLSGAGSSFPFPFRAMPPEIYAGPPLRGSPWLLRLPVEPVVVIQAPTVTRTPSQATVGEIQGGPPLRGAPWLQHLPTDPTLTAAAIRPVPPPSPPVREIRGGPPLRGAPWLQHLPIEVDSSAQGRAAPTPPTPQVYAPEIHSGPAMHNAPWFVAAVTQSPGAAQPSPLPPPPPPGPPGALGRYKPNVPRFPEAEPRLRRHTEIVSIILNSLLTSGQIRQTAAESFVIDPAAFTGGGTVGLSGTFPN